MNIKKTLKGIFLIILGILFIILGISFITIIISSFVNLNIWLFHEFDYIYDHFLSIFILKF